MKYIVCKQFKRKGIGGEFNLRKGSTCEEWNGVIYHNNLPICVSTSMNAYSFFARNDDGHGYERFALTSEILDKIKEFVSEYNEEYMAVMQSDLDNEAKAKAISELQDKSSESYEKIREAFPNFLREGQDVFSFEFYNGEVSDLEEVRELCLSL